LFLLALGCVTTRIEPTGGETHFLKLCDADSNSCGAGLECLCGVCTLLCNEQSTCSEFPNAQCVLESNSAEALECSAAETRRCDVPCTEDGECRALSAAHECVSGVCRVGSRTEPSPPPSSDAADGADAMACTPDDIAPSQVVLMGDSFFGASHQIAEQLAVVAQREGELGAGETYRDVSRLPDNALAFMGEGILDEYNGAKAEGPVSVVIMNGGGADALWVPCESDADACPELVAAADALRALFVQMQSDGISDVIFVGYPDPVPPEPRASMTFLRPLLKDACDTAPVPCHWLDLLPLFAGQYATYIEDNGLDPTLEGATVTAEAIWEVMQQRCVAR
jgi:hypothetical protein